jgi:GTP cyclohydrolase II
MTTKVKDPEVATSPLRTKYGDFSLHVFSWSENEQDNVLALTTAEFDKLNKPLVRVQSACYTGEIFESLDCDCHWQLETSLGQIAERGGIFVYMLCDGRGAGLLTKIRGMHLTASTGIDTADAYEKLGVELDPRNYERVGFILKYFNKNKCTLLTNNPRKIEGLVQHGIAVERESIESVPTEDNRSYLEAKAKKLGHLLVNY